MAGEFEVGSVKAKVTADLSQFQQGMAEAKAESGGLGGAMSGLKDNITQFAETAAVALAAVGLGIGDLVKQSVDVASNFEQTQTSFGTLLGSEQKAADLMKDIMAFEQHTPFDITTLTDAAKQMLAFGVNAADVVPKMKMLTDMSQGQASKLQELVSIYGQVNSIQSLNGREVLRLSSIGIPIYQAIADHYNKMGSAATDAGGQISAMTNQTVNNSKMSASARQAATDRLNEETTALKISEEQHPKTALAIEKHDAATQKLKDHIAEATAKLGTHTVAVGGLGSAAKVTADQVRDMISNHQITAGVFDQVLTEMTSKGGLFFNENIRQMSTFSGIMSSVRSQFQYLALSIMGIDVGSADEVRKGGLFYELREGAAQFLSFITANRSTIADGFKTVIDTIMNFAKVVGGALKPLIDYMGQHKQQTMEFLQGLALGFALLLVIIPAILLAANPMILILLAIEVAVGLLYVAWSSNLFGIRDIANNVIHQVVQFFQTVLMPFIQLLVAWWKDHWETIRNILAGVWYIIEGIIEVAWGLILAIIAVAIAIFTGKWSDAWKFIVNELSIAWDGIMKILEGAIILITNVGAEIFKALVKPFQDAYNAIKGIVNGIKGWLDFTQRHSPSVLDVVQNGVGLVNQALTGINFMPTVNSSQIAGNILPSISNSQSYSSMQSGLTISLPGAIVSDQATATALGEKIGDAIIDKLKMNVRF